MQTKVAAIQMTSSQDVKENLLNAEKLITEAVDKEAKLIVLPEMFAMMGVDQMDKVKHKEKLNSGPIQDFLREQALKNKVWIVGGTIPVEGKDENKVRAMCPIYNEKGDCVATYNKIFLFDVDVPGKNESYRESNTVEPGDKVIVIPTPFGKLGVAVCYDLRFPELFRAMQEQGAEIIALPSAFTYHTGLAHWEILVRARAIENQCYVVAAAQTGTHANSRKTFGYSMIVNPWGEVKSILENDVGIVIAEVDLDYLGKIRQEFPALSHRKSLLCL